MQLHSCSVVGSSDVTSQTIDTIQTRGSQRATDTITGKVCPDKYFKRSSPLLLSNICIDVFLKSIHPNINHLFSYLSTNTFKTTENKNKVGDGTECVLQQSTYI